MRQLMIAAVFAAALAEPARAQSTSYYITNGDAQIGYIVRDGVLQSTFALPTTGGTPLYAPRFDASGTKLLVSNLSGSQAVEFNANGSPTGTVVTNSQQVSQLLDGGTDGVFTYAVRCCSTANGLYRGDMNFGGLTRISTVGESGVAFANSIGHIFDLDRTGALFELALDGTLLNTYQTALPGAAALAYEASTNTLWLARNGTNQIYNISLTGQQLGSYTVAGLGGNFWGGEMANAVTTTPEPASIILLATGLVGVLGATRRKRRATSVD